MNRIVFDLQFFATINFKDNTIVSGTAGNDDFFGAGQSNVTIDAGAGDDTIYGYSTSNVSINAGAGNDSIKNEGNYNVTITSGAGNDTISLYHYSEQTTITDFDVSDVLQLMRYDSPTFAKFSNNVLNIDGMKINLPNVTDIDDYRDMIIRSDYLGWDGDDPSFHTETTLGKLLDVPAPYWKLSGTTATYYDADGKLLATLTGLKSGLKVVNGEIAGIDVEYGNKIVLSKSVLGTGTVTLTNEPTTKFALELADDVAEASFETDCNDLLICTWKISGTTATCTTKSWNAGYYVVNNTVRYVADNSTITLGKIVGLRAIYKNIAKQKF